MNPFLIIAALLILYSLKNYKQGFFLFLAFRLFLNNNINLINLPGVPLLTLEVFMSIFFALLYVIKRKRYSRVITTSPLPFNKVFIWVLLSYVVSSFISIAGIQQRRYTESCQYIIRSLADNLHICIYRKIPGLQSRNGL